MLRLNFLLMAVALAAVPAGCTQCDTCDDFPTPCYGGNCGPQGYAPVAPGGPAPEAVMGMPPGTPTLAPLPPPGPSVFAPTAETQPAPAPAPPAPGPDLSPPAPPSLGDAGKPVY